MNKQEWVGIKNNLLTITEYLGVIPNNWGYNSETVRCKCDCGGVKDVKLYQFKTGHVKSCGCLADIWKEKFPIVCNATTHGYTHHELHNTWVGMMQRCYNTDCVAYSDYGGRGIEVCKEWREDFIIFYNWAKQNGYSPELTLDRHPNNDGNYEPSNCRWATPRQQANNRRSTRYVELNGNKMSMADACREVGMTYKIINQRIVRDKLTFEEAISKPIKRKSK